MLLDFMVLLVTLWVEKSGVQVYPKPETLDVIQNKRTQKDFYTAQNLPTASYTAFCLFVKRPETGMVLDMSLE